MEKTDGVQEQNFAKGKKSYSRQTPVLRQETGEKRKPRAGQLGIGSQTRFKPGQSGNPGGRPTKFLTVVSDAVRDALAEIDPKTGLTHAEIIGRGLVHQISEDCRAQRPLDRVKLVVLKEVLDRAEGKPEQRLAVAGGTEEPEDPEQVIARLLALAAERVAGGVQS